MAKPKGKAKLPNKGDKNVSSAQVQTTAAVQRRNANPETKEADDATVRRVIDKQ